MPTVARSLSRERRLERETGIEPATNSLEGCDSTTELLPPSRSALRRASPPSFTRRSSAGKPAIFTLRSLRRRTSAARPAVFALQLPLQRRDPAPDRLPRDESFDPNLCLVESHLRLACQPKLATRAKAGGEGRIRTFEAARATDLQSAAFDRFATSPNLDRPWLSSCSSGDAPTRLPQPALRATTDPPSA